MICNVSSASYPMPNISSRLMSITVVRHFFSPRFDFIKLLYPSLKSIDHRIILTLQLTKNIFEDSHIYVTFEILRHFRENISLLDIVYDLSESDNCRKSFRQTFRHNCNCSSSPSIRLFGSSQQLCSCHQRTS